MVRKVFLVGAGPGNPDLLTARAKSAIENAGLLIGARRLLEPYRDTPSTKLELVKSGEILAALHESSEQCACVLLSGDPGFYSGAKLLRDKLACFELESIPGVSSLVYFCAKIDMPWQDVHLTSAHGRACNVAGEVQAHAKTFMLTGGELRVGDVCQLLVDAGLGDVHVWAGENLSYANERIVDASAWELAGEKFENLAVVLVENGHPISRGVQAPALADSSFERGDAPMTKEEVRALAISKLKIHEQSVVWDVGAGTGSVCVEAALAACKGSVYAIEKDDAALSLLEKNKARFGVTNLHIVAGEAPEALEGLPTPDRVFVGGSAGKLSGIIERVLSVNPQVRICMTAVTLETISEILECVERYSLAHVDIAQLSVSKARRLRAYHMMNAQNPVYLVSADAHASEHGGLR